MNFGKIGKQILLQMKNKVALYSAVSLILSVFCVIYPFELFGYPGWEFYWKQDWWVHLQRFIPFVSTAAIVLFVMYIFVFHKQSRARYSVHIALGLMSLCYFLDAVSIIRRAYYFSPYALFLALIYLLLAGIFLFAVKNAIKGKLERKQAVQTAFFGLAGLPFPFIDSLINYVYWDTFSTFFYPLMRLLCFAFFYTALLLFFKNTIAPQKNAPKEMDPEKALKQLKEQFEAGVLSEEVYQARRADIISKL